MLTREQLEAGLNCNTSKCKDCLWYHESKSMLKDRCMLTEEKILRHGIEMLDRNEALEAMLKKLEWEQVEWSEVCPWCHEFKINGHHKDCELAKLLEGRSGR